MKQPLKIAIAGAGIGGLAAAALLADQDHDVTLFDQFDTPRPVGSGLVIQPVGRRVLDAIGAGDTARAYGVKIHQMLGQDVTHGRWVLDAQYGKSYGLAIHRAALFDSLLQAVNARSVTLQQSHTITARSTEPDGQYLDFETGTRAGPFDLIIDSSGSHSPLSPLKSRPLPYGAIWASVDWPETEISSDQLSQRYRRANRMIGVMPMGTLPNENTPKAAMFWSMPRDGYDDWKAKGLDAWKDEAHTLWPALTPFLEQITSAEQMTMARYSHGTLRKTFADGIAYIGDAAHRASPQLGQGANMALLDAWALARALQSFPLETALPAYARARRAHVWMYQMMSAAFTPMYQSDSRILPFLRDNLFYPLSVIPPAPRIVGSLVTGNLLPPLGYLTPQAPAQETQIDQE